MRKFTITLLLVNLATFIWLVAGAQRELPPWQDSFKNTKDTVDQIVPATKQQAVTVAALKVQLEVAESSSRITIEKYRRPELPLILLTILNMVGLFLLSLTRKAEPGVAPNGSLPPP